MKEYYETRNFTPMEFWIQIFNPVHQKYIFDMINSLEKYYDNVDKISNAISNITNMCVVFSGEWKLDTTILQIKCHITHQEQLIKKLCEELINHEQTT